MCLFLFIKVITNASCSMSFYRWLSILSLISCVLLRHNLNAWLFLLYDTSYILPKYFSHRIFSSSRHSRYSHWQYHFNIKERDVEIRYLFVFLLWRRYNLQYRGLMPCALVLCSMYLTSSNVTHDFNMS